MYGPTFKSRANTELLQGKKEGDGRLTFADGSYYEGQFR